MARQTLIITEAQQSSDQQADHNARRPEPWQEQPVTRPLIAHPKKAPSALPAEQFFLARQGLQPAYIHNQAASKIARISNLFAEAPNFRNLLDIMA